MRPATESADATTVDMGREKSSSENPKKPRLAEGLKPPVGEVYNAIEGARGEMGYYIVSNGSGKPYRFHMRAPSFYNVAFWLLAYHYQV